jgi:hypothetical protein
VSLLEFQTVRIKALLREAREYDPFGGNERAPRIGDTGTVVDVGSRPAGKRNYIVECGRVDGTCAWIADFVEEELEALTQEENVSSDWRLLVGTVAAVLFFLALMVAAAAGLFFVWPPDSAVGAGFRVATVGVVFVAAGSLLAGERVGGALITATIVGVVFFVLGAVGWYSWAAI